MTSTTRFVAAAWLTVIACATESSSPSSANPAVTDGPDAAAPTDAGTSTADAARDARSTNDAEPAPPTACAQDAPCVADDYCTSNDGAVHRYCHCGVGKYACGERTAEPATTCKQGGACTGSGTCAVDDGTRATYCRCGAAGWACNTLTEADPNCSVNAQLCAFGAPAGATEWMRCFKRDISMMLGAICKIDGNGMQAGGTALEAVCPEDPPLPGAACGIGLSSIACACKADDGTPCICDCSTGEWRCL